MEEREGGREGAPCVGPGTSASSPGWDQGFFFLHWAVSLFLWWSPRHWWICCGYVTHSKKPQPLGTLNTVSGFGRSLDIRTDHGLHLLTCVWIEAEESHVSDVRFPLLWGHCCLWADQLWRVLLKALLQICWRFSGQHQSCAFVLMDVSHQLHNSWALHFTWLSHSLFAFWIHRVAP